MTLMEYSLFKAIKPWEYLCWNTKMKQTKSANILTMINKFNVVLFLFLLLLIVFKSCINLLTYFEDE